MNFPKNLSIQTTSFCNGHCIFCPSDRIKALFPRTIMDMGLYKKIIDECCQHRGVERIILYLNNEPLTDPYLIERINYAKEKVPGAAVHLLTNGSLLTEKLSEQLIKSRLDWIGFSLHGIRKDTFEKSMGLNYEATFKAVLGFIELAKRQRNIQDFIMVTFLRHKYLSQQEADESIKFWQDKGLTRINYFDGLISRAGNVKDLPPVLHRQIHGCCSIWANEMIHIVENGDVVLCCMDWKREVVLGNLNSEGIRQIWNSAKYEGVREKRDGKVPSLANFICKRCEAALPEKETVPVKSLLTGKNSLDMLLVICPVWGTDMPPLGLASIASYLEAKDIKVKVLDFNIDIFNTIDPSLQKLWNISQGEQWDNHEFFQKNKDWLYREIDSCVEKIISSSCKLVGFSIYAPNRFFSIEVMRKVKKINPQITIIAGGRGVYTVGERNIFPEGSVDYFFVGEGEGLLDIYLSSIFQQANPKYTENIIPYGLMNQEAVPYFNPDLDVIPYVTFAGFDLEKYKQKSLPITMSKGCISRCAFCDDWRAVGKYRIRQAEEVFKEIDHHVKQLGVSSFYFNDLAINGNSQELEKLCDLIIANNLQIDWIALAIPMKSMNLELLKKMRQAGCVTLNYGIESGSNKILRLMGKLFTAQEAAQVLEDTREAKINTQINLIIGFPGEGDEEFQQTLDFIKNNRRHICGITNLNTCNAPLGSELSRDCKKFELFFPVQGLLRDSRWQTQDGNTYALRTKRAKEALVLAKQLEIPIFVSNVYAKMITEKSLSGARLTEECQSEKKDILLIVCPVWGTEAPPLGIAYLYSYLKQKGLSPAAWDINIDMFNDLYTEAGLWKMQNYRLWNDKNLFESKILPLFDHKIDHYVKEICAQDIKIVGFSVNAGNSLFSIEMARRIKKEDPRKIIIFGGPHSKWFRNDIDHLEKYIDVYRGIYPGLVDIFVIGEGELALSRIIKCIKNNQKLDTVPGIIFYRDNKYVQSVGEGLVDVLDDIPFPDFTWTDSHKYAEKKTYILMSRGCIRRCAFCNDYFVSSKFRCRSAGNVFEEIKKRLQENKINNFEFCDVMLNADAQALGELCELIIKSGIKIKWTGQGAIKKDMTQDLLFKMKESGCSTITYGIETFSDKVLGLMNKPFSYEDIQRVLSETSNAKIEGYINIITGFPGETEVEFSQTVKRLKECSKFIRGISSLAPCLVTLGSSLQLNPEKYGIIHTEKDSYFNWHTKDGNNYALRKSRISRILLETSKLKLPVGIVNLYDDENLDSKEGAVTEDTNNGLDFLLVNLPPWAQENPHIGIGYICGFLRANGVKVKVLDLNKSFFINHLDYRMLWHVENKNFWSDKNTFNLMLEIFKDDINNAIKDILRQDPLVIGFSVVDPKEKLTIEFIKKIKTQIGQARIILGGPATLTPEQRDIFVRNIPDDIDIFVVGEGEETALEIINRIKDGKSLENISGTVIKNNNTWIYKESKPIEKLDNVPFPTYEEFDLSLYGKSLLLEWSRGCKGKCAFCKNWQLFPLYRSKNPDWVIAEVKYHYNKGIRDFTVVDNVLNGDNKNLYSICQKIIKNNLSIDWSGQIAPSKDMDLASFKIMKKAGCNRLQIGVESASNLVLKRMRKAYTWELAEKAIRLAKKAGIETEIFIMVGFPGENSKEFQKTVDFIKRNKRYIDAIKSINTLHLIAGTDIFQRYREYNLKSLPADNWHYLWETSDGNTYETRKKMAKQLLELSFDLGVKVIETNINEGKEKIFSDSSKDSLAGQLKNIKTDINRLQEMPKHKKKPIIKPHNPLKFILLGFIFCYTLFYIVYFWLFKKIKGWSLLGGD